jgi:hypothetical protein
MRVYVHELVKLIEFRLRERQRAAPTRSQNIHAMSGDVAKMPPAQKTYAS